ncbi:MAG TPA: hypothetical protein VFC74_09410 [Oscillospiraceae bacterium]|nr:hypothetical protein [Oscillospiraceae bacterium]
MEVTELKITNQSQAKKEIAKVGASTVSINIMAPKAVFRVIKITGISPIAANILKQEMLSKGGEAAVPAGAINCKEPSCDVIMMGTLQQFRKVIRSLRIQPLTLPAIAELIKEQLFEAEA